MHWFYGPDGQAEIFDECPEGWYDHPSLVPHEDIDNLSEIQKLRAAYREKFDKKPGPNWDEATLREKLEE